VLERVRERLAGDEVGRGLHLRWRAVLGGRHLDRDGRPTREVGQRGGEPLVEPWRPHARGDRPQVGDRGRDLVDGGVERRVDRHRSARQRALDPAQHDAERDQPLLRAVVQVALDPAALGVAGLGDPRARGLDLGKLQPQLHAQPRELHRRRRRGDHRTQQVGPVAQRRVVQEQAELAVVAADHGPRAIVIGQRVEHVTEAVRVGAGRGQPEHDLGPRIAERQCHGLADVLGLGATVPHLVEELPQQSHRV
jgi:hypothetical protein